MSIDHLPGSIAILLDGDYMPAGEVEVDMYLQREKKYKVWWTYRHTGESELIKVPEWHLKKKQKM
ncbi:MAG: hypothetical protein V4539_01285 [Bacteroidota bacterium]